MSRFHHLAHLKYPPIVKVGDWVKRGQLLGYVGNTGNSTGAHLHYEVKKSEPLSWVGYVNGWSLDRVKREYEDPSQFIKDGVPADFSYKGSGFLQWTGSVFHPGLDINSPNDEGKPVYSPVEGRVRYVAGVEGWQEVLRRWLPKYFNQGWGNHAWVEEKPGFKF